MTRRSSRGFTMVELLIGMVVLATVAVSMTRLLVSQVRFYDRQAAKQNARTVSRTAVTRLISDLRMVDADSGVVSAAATDITIRVPYALGISCSRSVISLLPLDSLMYAVSGPGGYSWRGSTGVYNYVESGVSVATNTSTTCSDSSVQVLTSDGGRQLTLSPSLPNTATAKGTIVFLIRKVRYQLKASTLVPGSYGLYRQVTSPSTTEEEIAAPFSTNSKFRFFVGTSATAQDAAPTDLTTVRGFELNLYGQTESKPVGESDVPVENFITAVFFKNRRT